MSGTLVRDIPETSGYWAAAWAMGTLPDVHMICDAPVGCYNLLSTAVSNYTDAIPELPNITPSFIREAQVGGSGTAPIVQTTFDGLRDSGALNGKRLIVLSTAESEMIGSDLTDFVAQLQPGAKFYHSESLTEDEWAGRDRVLRWLWENYAPPASELPAVEPGLVNIIGPTLGCFNGVSDLHEVRRLIEGAGGRVNLVFPYQSRLDQIGQLARGQVNVLLYREFGHGLAEQLGQPVLYAPFGLRGTTEFIAELGRIIGTTAQAQAFIREEKRTTLQAVWDLWKGPQSDWYATTSVGIVATETYVRGLTAFLGEELGMPIAFTAARPLRPGDMDNSALRQRLHAGAPSFLFGSITEKIYLSEAGSRFTNFIPAAFPGPIVRRSMGTPFMGYRGTVHLIQEIVNRLYEALFNVLPVDAAYTQGRGPGGPGGGPPTPRSGAQPSLPWQPAAKAMLDAALEKYHFLTRISASQELQTAAESYARAQQLSEVTQEVMTTILATRRG
jgi:chlorophyllide a reductase subunit Z